MPDLSAALSDYDDSDIGLTALQYRNLRHLD